MRVLLKSALIALGLSGLVSAANADQHNIGKVKEAKPFSIKPQKTKQSVKRNAPRALQNSQASEIAYLKSQVARLTSNQNKINAQIDIYKKEHENEFYGKGDTVTISPLVGRRSSYTGGDLFVKLPSINEDLRLLKQRQKLLKRIGKTAEEMFQRPILEISGMFDGRFVQKDTFSNGGTSQINLHRARLEFLAEVAPWAQAFMSIDYDSNPNEPEFRGAGFPISNSRLFLRRGFLTFGNLNRTPFYGSIGQMFLPIGRYAAVNVTGLPVSSITQTNERAIVAGFSKCGFDGQIYAYNGSAYTGSSNDTVNGFGANLTMDRNFGPYEVVAGTGIIRNVADAGGMQDTTRRGTGQFQGFDKSIADGTEHLEHKVPGVNANLSVTRGPYRLYGEYSGAVRHFARTNMSQNGHGAKPEAIHGEADYTFKVWRDQVPAMLGLAYDESWDSLPLDVAKRHYTIVASTNIWKNTTETLQFQHSINYDAGDTYNGNGGGNTDAKSTGGTANSILFNLKYVF